MTDIETTAAGQDGAEPSTHGAFGSPQKQGGVHVHIAPLPHQPQRDPLDAARLKAVEEGQHAHAGAPGRSRSP